MNKLKSFLNVINYQTLLVTAFAILSTYLSKHFNLEVDFPLTLIGIAIVFPIVFSINSAYKRRELALNYYGELKAHGRAIFFACRDWTPHDTKAKEAELKNLLKETLIACRNLFHVFDEDESDKERLIYKKLSELSLCVNSFRELGIGSSEVSRCNQYLSKMILAFEKMKHIYQYRTPKTLRAYSSVFIYLLPILYGPYFAHLHKEHGTLLYFMPILFSVVLVSLDNIQDHLENPFDQIGEDDLIINAEKFVDRLDL